MRCVILIISLICIESRGYDNNSASGSSQSAFVDSYTVESHESYRPTSELNRENQNKKHNSSTGNNNGAFSDVTSSENVKYFVTANENLSKIEIEKLSLDYSDERESAKIKNNSDFVLCGKTKVSNFLQLGKHAIEEDFNYTSVQENSSNSAAITIDVIHDVFETSLRQGGLLEGIVYKRKSFYKLSLRTEPSHIS